MIVLLGNSSARKRARFLMVIAFHYCFCWLRPRASVVALHLGYPRIDEGFIVRLLEVGAKVFLFFFLLLLVFENSSNIRSGYSFGVSRR